MVLLEKKKTGKEGRMNILILLDYVTVFGRRNKHQFERTQFGRMAEIRTFPRCPGLHSPTVALGQTGLTAWHQGGQKSPDTQVRTWGAGSQPWDIPSAGRTLRVPFSPAAVLSLGGVCRRTGMCCAAQPQATNSSTP